MFSTFEKILCIPSHSKEEQIKPLKPIKLIALSIHFDSGFCSTKRLGVLLIPPPPPGWDASLSQVTSKYFVRLHVGGEKYCESKVNVLPKNTNQH